jgi:tripartite-type tricarboxylate transporter receptor subunit TctC
MLKTIAALWLALSTTWAAAQDYPARPVRIVAPFPPGQSTELVARTIGLQFTQAMGQSFFIDNKPGASGIIGTEFVKNSAADGYTLLVAGSGPLAINMAMYAKLPYDSLRDFQPIGMIAAVPNVLLVAKDFPASNLREVLAYVRQNPGKVNYASSGVGVPNHLIMELLKSATGVQITHVPYKGASASITGLMGGEVSLMFEAAGAVVPHVKGGRVKVIATSGPQRSQALPDVPTVAESGVPGFGAQGWSALLAPANTPRPVVQKLNAELTAALAKPDVKKRLLDLGVDPVEMTLEQTVAYMKSEVENWAKAVKLSGARVD